MRTTPLEIEGLPPVTRCLWAERARERMRGLLGRDGLAPGEAMAFPRCRAVHTVGMRFPIDVAFLGRDGRPVRTVRAVPPGRLLVWGGWRARTTVEAAAGWIPPPPPTKTNGRSSPSAPATPPPRSPSPPTPPPSSPASAPGLPNPPSRKV